MTTTHPTTETTTETPVYDATSAEATATIDRYLATWNETDPARRRALVDECLGADVWYRDPMLAADGREAYDAMVAAVQAQLPGQTMRRTTEVDAHRDLARFGWELGEPGQDPTFRGIDAVKLDSDGRLHRIIGFVGDLVPVAGPRP